MLDKVKKPYEIAPFDGYFDYVTFFNTGKIIKYKGVGSMILRRLGRKEKMMNPKVSIIIPVYNAETTIRRTVESLVYGEEKDIEVILVDDCSVDNSWNVCLELQEEFENVRCVKNYKNSGVSYTRNHGIKEAKSPYILFVDSDDWVSPKYIIDMLNAAYECENSLPVCGFKFCDQVNSEEEKYIWNAKQSERLINIFGAGLFDAVDRCMMQFCWNKIFKLDIIKENDIKFDESQSMGEDFEFVLDYMKAANLHQCTMVNEALYYYVRANQTSLMSNFGWTTHENEIRRLNKLSQICGETIEIDNRLKLAKQKMKENLIYHVVRTHNKTKQQKIAQIEKIMQDGMAKKYFKDQKNIMKKEKLVQIIMTLKNILKKRK